MVKTSSQAGHGPRSTTSRRPTLIVYPAAGENTGAAVVVFPGGGYKLLAIDLEGTEVCLYPHGGHAFGLRRTAQPITHWPELVERWLAALRV